ncbi:MAG: N-acetyl-alpha-D-glucosaminyl L-malate synthase BshA [Planctomycetota bacterium]
MEGSPLRLGVVCYPTVGGSSVVATEVALGAAAEGHDVHLISYDRPHRLRAGVAGLRYHAVGVSGYPLLRFPPYDLALATRMLEVQEEADIQVFHVHYAIPHAVSAFLARSMASKPLRFITTLHGTDITVVGADRAYMRPTRFAIEQSNAVTAVSQFLADETSLLFGIRSPIQVIPNFVDTEVYQRGSGQRWTDRADEERVIIHASNFRPVKRVADVVRAFAVVAREIPARLVLIGDGPDREHALAVATDLGVRARVETIDRLHSLETALANADLCLSASETESFGLSLLEAMSCEVPCATSDVGGVREVVGDTGAYAPAGEPELLGQAALGLLRDPEQHRALGQRARQRALDKFDQSKILGQYLSLYQRVVADG